MHVRICKVVREQNLGECVVVAIVGVSFSTGVILLPHFFRDDARLMWVTDTVCDMVLCVCECRWRMDVLKVFCCFLMCGPEDTKNVPPLLQKTSHISRL